MKRECTGCRLAIVLFCLALASAAGLAGCSSSDTGYVSGRVTLSGSPVTEGSVLFEDAAAGISVHAALGPDGAYTVKTYDRDGLPPGTYKVAITTSKFGDGEAPLVGNPAAKTAAVSRAIPQRYTSTATSGLSTTVKVGENPPVNFDLTP